MKVLVTGGAGFIGHHVVLRLLEDGHDVRILDNLSNGIKEKVPGSAELIVGDVQSEADVALATDGVSHVIHLAGLVIPGSIVGHDSESWRTNVVGTKNVCDVAAGAGVERLVFSSSAAVYGDKDILPISEHAFTNPKSQYGHEKVIAEGLVRSCGVPHTILRLFNVYGDWPKADGLISRLMRAANRDRKITIIGDGSQTRDYVSVASTAYRAARAMIYPEFINRTVNFGAGIGSSTLSIVSQIECDLGVKFEISYSDLLDYEIHDSIADTRLMDSLWRGGCLLGIDILTGAVRDD